MADDDTEPLGSGSGGLSTAAELLAPFLEDDFLGVQRVTGLNQRGDLLLLLVGEHYAGFRQRGDSLDRVVEGFADTDAGSRYVFLSDRPAVHGGSHVDDGLGGLVENVVTLTGFVSNAGERQQQVFARLNGFVVNGVFHAQCGSQVADLVRSDVRCLTGGLDYGFGLLGDQVAVLGLGPDIFQALNQPGTDQRSAGQLERVTGGAAELPGGAGQQAEPALGDAGCDPYALECLAGALVLGENAEREAGANHGRLPRWRSGRLRSRWPARGWRARRLGVGGSWSRSTVCLAGAPRRVGCRTPGVASPQGRSGTAAASSGLPAGWAAQRS